MAINYSENQLSKHLRRMLYILGLCPQSKRHPLYSFYSFMLFFIMPFAYSVFTSVSIFTSIDDVNRFTEAVFTTLAVVGTLFKLLNYIYHETNVNECYEKLSAIQLANRSNDQIFYKKLKTLRLLSLILYGGANACVTAATFKALLATDYELPISSWYPLDWQHSRRVYWIVCCHSSIGAFVVCNISSTLDCYVCYLMGMATAQFEMLYEQIEELGSNSMKVYGTTKCRKMALKGDVLSVKSRKLALKDDVLLVKLCLNEHQRILSLVSDIKRYFSFQFLTQFCLSGATIGALMFNVNAVSPEENIFRFAFLFAFLFSITLQTFLYTYYGNGISESSNSLSRALYFSNWYAMIPELGQTLVIFMERLKRKSEILAANVFPLDLESFTIIMELSYRLYLFFKSF